MSLPNSPGDAPPILKVAARICADDEIVYGVMNLASILRHSTPREEE